jgi:hypothetical protein
MSMRVTGEQLAQYDLAGYLVIEGFVPPESCDRLRNNGNRRYPADNWLQRSPELPLRGFD